jgi:DNA-3-methyladenine glycosylase II
MPRRSAPVAAADAGPNVPIVTDFASPDFPTVLAAATEDLAGRDPVLGRLVAAVGPPDLDRRRGLSHFGALCRSIVFQQLAGRAAAAIFGRFVATVTDGGEAIHLSPEKVVALPEEALRAAGLSAAKTRSIRGLAEGTLSGEVPLHDVERLGDEELITRLSTVPGIGRWTAEMFLIFQLGRLDVWPVGDFGVRKGYATAWGLAEMPTPKELAAYGETFRPYRSIAAWYCWRAVDTIVPDSSDDPPAPPRKPTAKKPPAAKNARPKKTPPSKQPAANKAMERPAVEKRAVKALPAQPATVKKGAGKRS